MTKFFIDFACWLGLVVAASVVYLIIFYLYEWSLAWSNTIIALFIFMGCPIVLTIAWWAAIGMASIPIRTRFWFILSELIFVYFAMYSSYVIWIFVPSLNGGWQIAIRVIYNLIYAGIYGVSTVMLYSNSKENWDSEQFFSFIKRQPDKQSNIKEIKEPQQPIKERRSNYEHLEKVHVDDFIKRVTPLYPDIHNTEELYNKILSDLGYVKRYKEETQAFAKNLNKCPELADIVIALFNKTNDNEYPELALLELSRELKDLISGRISVEQYKNRKNGIIYEEEKGLFLDFSEDGSDVINDVLYCFKDIPHNIRNAKIESYITSVIMSNQTSDNCIKQENVRHFVSLEAKLHLGENTEYIYYVAAAYAGVYCNNDYYNAVEEAKDALTLLHLYKKDDVLANDICCWIAKEPIVSQFVFDENDLSIIPNNPYRNQIMF